MGSPEPPRAADWGEAVDLARGFADGWTHDLPLDAVEEWARQLYVELRPHFADRSVPPDGTRLHAADLQERLGIMVQDSGEGYAIVDFDALEKVEERVNQLEKALAYENPRHPLLPPLLPVAGKDAKPPCLYPLPDGRRCLECETCHAGGGRGARVNQLEQALRRIAEGDVGLPRFSYDAVTAHQNSMDIAAEALSAAGEDAKP